MRSIGTHPSLHVSTLVCRPDEIFPDKTAVLSSIKDSRPCSRLDVLSPERLHRLKPCTRLRPGSARVNISVSGVFYDSVSHPVTGGFVADAILGSKQHFPLSAHEFDLLDGSHQTLEVFKGHVFVVLLARIGQQLVRNIRFKPKLYLRIIPLLECGAALSLLAGHAFPEIMLFQEAHNLVNKLSVNIFDHAILVEP